MSKSLQNPQNLKLFKIQSYYINIHTNLKIFVAGISETFSQNPKKSQDTKKNQKKYEKKLQKNKQIKLEITLFKCKTITSDK